MLQIKDRAARLGRSLSVKAPSGDDEVATSVTIELLDIQLQREEFELFFREGFRSFYDDMGMPRMATLQPIGYAGKIEPATVTVSFLTLDDEPVVVSLKDAVIKAAEFMLTPQAPRAYLKVCSRSPDLDGDFAALVAHCGKPADVTIVAPNLGSQQQLGLDQPKGAGESALHMVTSKPDEAIGMEDTPCGS